MADWIGAVGGLAGILSAFVAAHPWWKCSLHDRIAESFARQQMLATLGARVLPVAEGEVVH